MHAAMGAAPVKHGPQEAKAPRLYDGQRNHDDFYPLSSDAVFGISRLTTASSCSIFAALFSKAHQLQPACSTPEVRSRPAFLLYATLYTTGDRCVFHR